MSRETERKAVIQHFLTTWGSSGKVALPNQPFTTPANETFVVVNIVERGSFRKSLGINAFFKRHENTLQIDIYVPADKGTTTSRVLADTLEPIYQDLVLPLSDGETVIFGTPKARVLALNEQRASNLEDNWDRYVVECPYHRDQFVEN